MIKKATVYNNWSDWKVTNTKLRPINFSLENDDSMPQMQELLRKILHTQYTIDRETNKIP